MTTISICLVGCGGMGSRHVQGFARLLRSGMSNVKLVAVWGERAGHEPVIGRVVYGRVEHPVELDHAALPVELVLVAAASRYLDKHVNGVFGEPEVGSRRRARCVMCELA